MSWITSSSISGNWTCSCTYLTTVYAVISTGDMYKSTDSGVTWTLTYSFGINITEIYTSNGVIIGVIDGSNQFYQSTNSGSSFTINTSFTFKHLAMTTSTPPRYLSSTTTACHQSTSGTSWSLFVSSLAGPFNSICCSNNVTSASGNIYINHDNTGIYYSNNMGTSGMSPYPSRPSITSVNCGKVICAKTTGNIVMTIYTNLINYSTNRGVSYLTNTLTNNLVDICCSNDGANVCVIDTIGDILFSSTGAGGVFSVMSGYSSQTWNSISGNSDLTTMVSLPSSGSINSFDATACIVMGSCVYTKYGEIKIENLKKGDTVISYGVIENDKNIIYKEKKEVKILWIGKRTINIVNDYEYPIFYKGMYFSQKHRIIWKDTFISINQLLNVEDMFIDKSFTSITYYHIETEEHNIINVGGIMTETMNNKEIDRKYLFLNN